MIDSLHLKVIQITDTGQVDQNGSALVVVTFQVTSPTDLVSVQGGPMAGPGIAKTFTLTMILTAEVQASFGKCYDGGPFTESPS